MRYFGVSAFRWQVAFGLAALLHDIMRVIYLHGFASSPASRKAQFFSEKFAAVGIPFSAPRLDQGNFAELTVTAQVCLVEELLEEAGEPVTLMGSSLGGYIAALVAVRRPKSVERLILLAPAFRLYLRWCEQLPEGALEGWRAEGQVMVYHYGEREERPIRYEFLEDAERYEAFPDFRQPALLFHGTEDSVVPCDYSERFVASHPATRLVKLQSGHELTDVLDRMWQETGDFLERRDH
jgi:pimeloyl-ACP methyl ester carboxylesterase